MLRDSKKIRLTGDQVRCVHSAQGIADKKRLTPRAYKKQNLLSYQKRPSKGEPYGGRRETAPAIAEKGEGQRKRKSGNVQEGLFRS